MITKDNFMEELSKRNRRTLKLFFKMLKNHGPKTLRQIPKPIVPMQIPLQAPMQPLSSMQPLAPIQMPMQVEMAQQPMPVAMPLQPMPVAMAQQPIQVAMAQQPVQMEIPQQPMPVAMPQQPMQAPSHLIPPQTDQVLATQQPLEQIPALSEPKTEIQNEQQVQQAYAVAQTSLQLAEQAQARVDDLKTQNATSATPKKEAVIEATVQAEEAKQNAEKAIILAERLKKIQKSILSRKISNVLKSRKEQKKLLLEREEMQRAASELAAKVEAERVNQISVEEADSDLVENAAKALKLEDDDSGVEKRLAEKKKNAYFFQRWFMGGTKRNKIHRRGTRRKA